MWDPSGVRTPRHFAGHTALVWAAAIGRVGRAPVVVSGGGDSTVRVWNATGNEPPLVLTGHVDTVRAVAVGTGEDPVVVSGGDDRTARVWDLSGRRDTVVLAHRAVVAAVAVGVLDGETVVISGAADARVRLWDRSGLRPRVLAGHRAPIWGVGFGELAGVPVVVSGAGSGDNTVRVWDGRTGVERARFDAGPDVIACAFTPDPSSPEGLRVLRLERPLIMSANMWAALAGY